MCNLRGSFDEADVEPFVESSLEAHVYFRVRGWYGSFHGRSEITASFHGSGESFQTQPEGCGSKV